MRKQRSEPPVSATLLVVVAVGVASIAALVVLTASGATDDGLGRALLHVLVVGAPVATGLYAVRAQRSPRFGLMLIGAALIWSLAVLAESSNSLAYSAGRVIAWCIFPLITFLMLTFPEGRFTARRDRLLVGAMAAVSGLLFIGAAPFVQEFPEHSPWTSCGADCPPNAFFILDAEPAFIDAVFEPARDALMVLLLIGVLVSLALRLRASDSVRLVTTVPVAVASAIATLLLIAFIVVRQVAPDSDAAEDIGLVWTLSLPGIATGFSISLLQRRLMMSNVLAGLSIGLRGARDPHQVAVALRTALGDREVEVLVCDPAGVGWLHQDGRTADLEAIAATGRAVRIVGAEQGALAAIVFEPGLEGDDDLLDAIVSLSESALRQSSLRAELDDSLHHLDESRKRIATAADAERRRIERDLHDGAQQRLIALRMRLSLAEDLLAEDPAAASEAIHVLGDDIDRALDEIRSLAQGIYPALLADRGLAEAIRSAGRRAPIPVEVRANGVSRHPQAVESALYFTCLEALQNALKHASGATLVTIALDEDRGLALEVVDDGEGFDATGDPAGRGLRNMRDRIESLGGSLAVRSTQGKGTSVRAVVPVTVTEPDAWSAG